MNHNILKKDSPQVATSLRFILLVNTYSPVPRDYYCLERHHQANAFILCSISQLSFKSAAKVRVFFQSSKYFTDYFSFFSN